MTEQTCTWNQDEDFMYESTCGMAFCFTDEGATENGFIFCPKCGNKLVDEKFEYEQDHDNEADYWDDGDWLFDGSGMVGDD